MISKKWNSLPLENLTSLIKDGTHGTHNDVDNGVPLLSAKDIRNESLSIPNDCRKISEVEYSLIHKNYKIVKNDILLTIVGTVGRCCLMLVSEPRFTIQRSVAVIRPQDIEPKYLYHYFLSEVFQRILKDSINASAQGGVYLGSLAKCIVNFPTSQEEQRKIADILSTIDRAISQTEAIAAKQQRIKTGLMQDLLTKGIDENGNIRKEETHEFKDSPLGRIPVEWEIETLDKLLIEKKYGISSSLSDDFVGIPVLRMNNLVNGEIDFTDLKYSDSEDAKKLKLNDCDLLFNRTNSIEYVGRTAIYRHTNREISFASYLVRLVPEKTKLSPEYLNLWLNNKTNQVRVKKFATIGVQQANINPTNLGTLTLALPKTILEQEKIVQTLSLATNSLRHLKQNLKKLHFLKTALMQDLLTGKVRVTQLLKNP